jgi:hypothetical protein
MPVRVQTAGRERGHYHPGGADLRPPRLAIHRRDEDAFATYRHGGGDQREPDQRLAGGSTPWGHKSIGFRELDGRLSRGLWNSPAASRVRRADSGEISGCSFIFRAFDRGSTQRCTSCNSLSLGNLWNVGLLIVLGLLESTSSRHSIKLRALSESANR